MPKNINPHPVKFSELVRRLNRFGVEIDETKGKGSHVMIFRLDDSGRRTGQKTVCPHHGSKDLMPSVVNAMLRRLGINYDDFWGA